MQFSTAVSTASVQILNQKAQAEARRQQWHITRCIRDAVVLAITVALANGITAQLTRATAHSTCYNTVTYTHLRRVRLAGCGGGGGSAGTAAAPLRPTRLPVGPGSCAGGSAAAAASWTNAFCCSTISGAAVVGGGASFRPPLPPLPQPANLLPAPLHLAPQQRMWEQSQHQPLG